MESSHRCSRLNNWANNNPAIFLSNFLILRRNFLKDFFGLKSSYGPGKKQLFLGSPGLGLKEFGINLTNFDLVQLSVCYESRYEKCAVRKGDFMVGSLARAAKAKVRGITSVDSRGL